MKQKNGEKNNGSQNDDPFDALISRAEREIDGIDHAEIFKGMSGEELQDRGLIGDKKNSIERSIFSAARRHAGLEFEQGIEYYIDDDSDDPASLPIELLETLPVIRPGTRIALKKLHRIKQEITAAKEIRSLFSGSYLANANIEPTFEEGNIAFSASKKGVVAVLKSLPYVIPIDRNGLCRIRIGDDAMEARADLLPHHGDGDPLVPDYVMHELMQTGVTMGINQERLAEMIDTVEKTGEPLENTVVAQGRPAVDGKNAEVDFKFSIEATHDDFTILPDGRIDYRKKAKIHTVHKEDIIAIIGEPGRGAEGFTVTGDVLTGKDGEATVVMAGENVSVAEDGKTLTAEIDGQALLNNNILSVVKYYTVDGDVDYSSGNINFNGHVRINGSILPGFEVKAEGDIIVMKGIEGGTVTAGRDVKVLGGIYGTSGSKVVCGRDLIAHHIQNALVEAQGDIHVANSCIQSEVYCTGTIFLENKKGAIIGGQVDALHGVAAANIGSQYGTKTEIRVGSDFLIRKKEQEYEEAIEFHERNLEKIDIVLAPVKELMRKGLPLGEDKKEKLALITTRRSEIKKLLAIMAWKLKEVRSLLPGTVNARLSVSGTVFPDVIVRMKEAAMHFRKQRDHVSLRSDPKTGEIVVSPL